MGEDGGDAVGDDAFGEDAEGLDVTVWVAPVVGTLVEEPPDAPGVPPPP